MSTPQEVAAKFARLAATIDKADAEAVKRGGLVAKPIIQASIAAASGGDSVLSRVRSGKGAKITTYFDLTSYQGSPQAEVKTRGPLPLIERPIVSHIIGGDTISGGRHGPAKPGQRTRRRSGRYIAFPDGRVRRGPVLHPGVSRPKEPFKKGSKLAQRPVAKALQAPVSKAIHGAFR